MSSEWRVQKISSLGEFDRGKSKHRPRDAAHLYGGPYPFIQTGDVTNSDGRITSFRQTYSEAGLAQSRLWPAGTLAITIAANIAETAILTFPACFPDSVVGFTADTAKADVRFIEYLFQAMRKQVKSHAYGSAQENINLEVLRKLEFPIPPLPLQTKIADYLSLIDDRIALLRETNATLEAIAQALFKSWFVDFDPVRAKMAGRTPEGMDEATAALFPDGFETSELGEVPRGWRVGMIGDFAQLKKGSVNPGSQPEATFEHFSLPSFDAGQRPIFERGDSIKSNKTPVTPDAVLLSKLNPHIPRIWLPVECGSNAVCSTEFLVFVPIGIGSRELIYCAFSSPDFIARLQQLVTGTSNSHQRIKPDQVALMSSVVPTADVARAFEAAAKPIFQKVFANRAQVQTLTTLRDTLLPRLISGQLRVGEVPAVEHA
ncbi:restriction endonuclease subunit S [Melaminivora jejuensis]|uniref:restriction endonuclease subunit S n=1 Tax=Melaminivora jejuensis TaxID=1267217 RepID=UPI001ADEF956|nr:restriction endonuclease subunit S [Melaminivora jejuensis]UHJ63944.1 restriction endonuclease subunit S [Melaminivora jejuensis]